MMDGLISVKNIFKLSMPAALSYATIVLVGVIDLYFIGKLGTTAIAATSIAVSVCTALYSFLDGVRTSTSVLTAQYWGAQDETGVRGVLIGALLFSVVVGFPALFFAVPVGNFVYWLVGNSDIVANGSAYLGIRLFSVPIVLLTFSLIGFFRGLHNTLMQLIVSASICIANIVLDYCLIYGKYGFPQLGVKGAAIATLIAEGIGLIVAVSMLCGSRLTRHRLSFRIPQFQFLRKHIAMAVEAGLYTGLTSLAISTFVFLFSVLGTQTLAIYQICSQIFFITYLPQIGFFAATSVIVGKLLGQGNFELITRAVLRASVSALSIAFMLSAITLMCASPLVAAFCSNDRGVVLGVAAILWLICLDQIVSTLCLVLKGALMGMNDTRFIAKVSFITGYLFFLPLAYCLGIILKMGLKGGYVAFVAWALLDVSIWSIRFVRKKSRLKAFALLAATEASVPASVTQENTPEPVVVTQPVQP